MGERMRWWDRLNRALYPYFGPAALGPGRDGERPVEAPSQICPVCGSPLPEHRIERSTDGHTATRLVCPDPSSAPAA